MGSAQLVIDGGSRAAGVSSLRADGETLGSRSPPSLSVQLTSFREARTADPAQGETVGS